MSAMISSRIKAKFRRELPGFTLDVDLDLPGRGVTALFGPSGSGKTSCLRLLAGLERAPGAQVEVNGEVWQDDAQGIFVPVHRRALGYVFQEASLFPHLSVRANLNYGRKRRGTKNAPVDFDRMVGLLGIEALLERAPAGLSGGERQRVAIARALLAGPRLLLMDEPLASLDQPRKREILPYLERLHDELDVPVVYVSHASDEVVRLADFLALLRGGRVLAQGPLIEMLARLDLPEEFTDAAGVVIEGTVGGYDHEYGLLRVDFTGGNLRVVHPSMPLDRRLRVQVKARDVSVTRSEPGETSILNLLPATVVAVVPAEDAAQVLVRLDAGGAPLVARITRRSWDNLRLAPGVAVWAQIKAVALLA